ncbi:MAG: LptF/LptG family permease [Alphaproteobacteria bacterium]|jgi:lipopolysaccharide export system permease protein|nr:LptF/LptG family permease [Alphaproteobacteria bacterium]
MSLDNKKNKKIIDNYIAKNFLKSMIFVMFVLLGVIFLFSFLEKFGSFSSKNISVFQTLFYTALEVPLTFQTVIPFSILIAGQHFFFKFSKTSEIVVFRSFGMSVWDIIKPIIKVIFFTGLFYAFAINPLISKVRNLHIQLTEEYSMKETNEFLFSKRGLWIKEKTNLTQTFINAKQVSQKGNIFHIKDADIYLFNDENKIIKQINAETGTLDKYGLFKFQNAHIYEPKSPKHFLEYYEYNTSLDSEQLQENVIYPDSISFWKLPEYSRTLKEIGLSTKEYEMFFYKILMSPLSFISMIFLALAFTLPRNNRNAKFLFRISAGITAGFIIYFLEQVFYAMGLSEKLPQIMSIIAVPTITILFSTIYIFFFEES